MSSDWRFTMLFLSPPVAALFGPCYDPIFAEQTPSIDY